MARSQETFTKREREKQRLKKQQDKKEKMQDRKDGKEKGKSLEDMMAYVDENGNLTDRPVDPRKKHTFRQEDMVIGVPKMEDMPADLQRNGVISFFNYEKGFGFITDLVTQERVFVHTSELSFPVKENDKVFYTREKGPKGPVATNIVSGKSSPPLPPPPVVQEPV